MKSTSPPLRILFRSLLVGAALSVLAACGSVSQTPSGLTPASSYLLTIPLKAGDTQVAVTQEYGGKVIVWLEGKQAVLDLTPQAATAFRQRGVSLQGASLDPNTSLSADINFASASGWNTWAGGWNTWAGGWNTWAGGWNTWAGGTSTTPTLPTENKDIWEQIRLYQAQKIMKNAGAGIKVAILDTGIDLAHPAFQSRLAPSTDWKDYFDGDTLPQEGGTNANAAYGHGTAVAGIVMQVAPKATLMPIRVLGPDGQGDLSQVIQGIYWAVDHGADVLNLSLGTSVSTQALYDSMTYAASQGVYVVSSAGNEAKLDGITFPARYTWWASTKGFLMGVGSSDKNSLLSSFSNYGWDLFAIAPGEKIVTTYPSNQTVQATGTSFAAPLTSGSVALALGETSNATERNKLFEYAAEATAAGGVHNLNLTSRGTDAIGSGLLSTESLLYMIPSFTPKVTPVASLGSNMGFESGSTGWTLSSSSIVGSGVRSGTKAASIANGGAVYRTITGLKQNTNYVASVWMKATSFTDSNQPGIWIWGFSKSNKKGNNLSVSMMKPSSSYIKLSMAFTTDSSQSVEFGVWGGAGSTYIDDLSLVEAGY